MKPTKLTQLLEDACRAHIYSGYQLYAERHAFRVSLAGGVTSYWPNLRPIEPGTLFDIGSVTKAVATASILARAVDRGQVTLEDPVAKYLPVFAGSAYAKLQLGELASHSAGLVGWFPMYEDAKADYLADWYLQHEKDVVKEPPRRTAVYSDLGFCLLALALQAVTETPWRKLFAQEVLQPLHLDEVAFGPLVPADPIAATEFSLLEGRLLQGEVFDENCRALGGAHGHAGLFASAQGLAPFAREWLNAVRGQSSWISQKTAKKFTQRAGFVPGSTWGFGWDGKADKGSTAGDRFSPASFGHLGYPGCSLWIDPVAEGFAIFLTNRVHPSRLDERLRQVRPPVHDAVVEAWTP